MAISAAEPDESAPSTAVTCWSDLLTPAALLALVWTFGQIALVIWPGIDTLAQRGLHVSFAVSLALLLSGSKFESRWTRGLNYGFAFLALLSGIPIAVRANHITSERIPDLDPVLLIEYALGICLMLLMVEAARRLLGLGLTLFVVAFAVYFFVGPYLPAGLSHTYGGLERFIDSQFLSLQGIFGVPTASVSTVFYFILFAAVYDVFGGGRPIIDIALTVTGGLVRGHCSKM